jgi:GGDEF domain-containing protein
MDALALVVWSMALGTIALFALVRLGVAAHPARSRACAIGYHLTVFLLVLVLSGVLQELHPLPARQLHVLQVLAGPLCVGVSNFWIQAGRRAAQRDRLMALGLRASALALPLLAVLAMWQLPHAQELPAAALLSLLGSGLTLWLTVRGWLMGDRLALTMAIGCALTLPAIAGLYALAMHVAPPGWASHLVFALCAATSNFVTGLGLLRRDLRISRARHAGARTGTLDPVTRLANGRSLVRRLVQALRRRRRTGRDGALLAVMVFDVDRITAQVGVAGVNDMWMALAARMQRQLGVVNPVGRYWDHCFVGFVETIPSLPWLRTLGLRVAVSLRHPIEVSSPGGDRVKVHADIGVGVVHLPPGPVEVEDVLHAAQRLAREARQMRSRAAMRDPVSAAVVPVEHAMLAPRRGWLRPAQARG